MQTIILWPVAALIYGVWYLLAAQAAFLAVTLLIDGLGSWPLWAKLTTFAPIMLLAAGVAYALALLALGVNLFPR